MIKGTGTLISDEDEEGRDLPFLTTEEILNQIQKFGFIVIYDVKSNLPTPDIEYLSELYNIGFDKVSRIGVITHDNNGESYIRPTAIVFKTCSDTSDLLKFDCTVEDDKFKDLLFKNVAVNITNQPDTTWDWISYTANISDILDENIDPRDPFRPLPSDPDPIPVPPDSYTLYDENDEDGTGH